MAETRTSDDIEASETKTAIIDAALRLMALQGWRDTSLQDIAAEAEISLAEMREAFGGKSAILMGISKHFDLDVLSALDPEIADEPTRDRIFDVVMRRIDVLTPHKEAIRNLLNDLSRDPSALACFLAGPMRQTIRWMLEAAKIDGWGPLQPLQEKGMGLLYLGTLRIWLKDDEPELSKTMAGLDKGLNRIEGILGLIKPTTQSDNDEQNDS
jgi:AcrR family transcriptional regulator